MTETASWLKSTQCMSGDRGKKSANQQGLVWMPHISRSEQHVMVQWSDCQFDCKQLRARRAKYSENRRKLGFLSREFHPFSGILGPIFTRFSLAIFGQDSASHCLESRVTSAESRVESRVIRWCDSSRVTSHKNVTRVMTRVESPSHESPALIMLINNCCSLTGVW